MSSGDICGVLNFKTCADGRIDQATQVRPDLASTNNKQPGTRESVAHRAPEMDISCADTLLTGDITWKIELRLLTHTHV